MNDKVDAVFAAAEAAGYWVREGRRRLILRHPRQGRIGGWDDRRGHWYISRFLAEGRETVPKSRGFESRTETTGHRYWRLDGVDGADAFASAVAELVGVPIALGGDGSGPCRA